MPNEVLSNKHLTILRAAVRFWREEMPSNERRFWQSYAGLSQTEEAPTQEDVDWLFEQLFEDQVYYGVCSRDRQRWVTDQIFESTEIIEHLSLEGEIVPVLLKVRAPDPS